MSSPEREIIANKLLPWWLGIVHLVVIVAGIMAFLARVLLEFREFGINPTLLDIITPLFALFAAGATVYLIFAHIYQEHLIDQHMASHQDPVAALDEKGDC